MFKTILVALDGTEWDEALLRHVAELAQRLTAEVVLLRAALARAASGRKPAEAQLEAVSAAEQHLGRLEQTLRTKGIKVRSVVPYGTTADAVVENAALLGADAVAFANCSRRGGREAMDLAEQLCRSGLPIFMVPVAGGNGTTALPREDRRCQNCGLAVANATFAAEDRCPRCGYFLRACPNCHFYDGIMCLMDNPQSSERYEGTACGDFRFRSQVTGNR